MISLSTESSMDDGGKHSTLHNKIKIVSQQSTARPGCVIQLDAIADATHVSRKLITLPTCMLNVLKLFAGLAEHTVLACIPRTADHWST